jgi:hypothetical protein
MFHWRDGGVFETDIGVGGFGEDQVLYCRTSGHLTKF